MRPCVLFSAQFLPSWWFIVPRARAGISSAIYVLRKHFTNIYEYDHTILDSGPGSHQHCGRDDVNQTISAKDADALFPAATSYGALMEDPSPMQDSVVSTPSHTPANRSAMQHFDLDTTTP